MFVYNSQIPTFPFILFYKLILLTYYIIYNHELLNSFSPLSLSIYSCSLKYLLAPVFIPKPEKQYYPKFLHQTQCNYTVYFKILYTFQCLFLNMCSVFVVLFYHMSQQISSNRTGYWFNLWFSCHTRSTSRHQQVHCHKCEKTM